MPCLCMLDRRLHILLDAERYDRLARKAEERGTSIATLVREALDVAFPAVDPRRAAAAKEILSAEPMPVPDVSDLLEELEEARGRHAR
jgi:hypothetical protein